MITIGVPEESTVGERLIALRARTAPMGAVVRARLKARSRL